MDQNLQHLDNIYIPRTGDLITFKDFDDTITLIVDHSTKYKFNISGKLLITD